MLDKYVGLFYDGHINGRTITAFLCVFLNGYCVHSVQYKIYRAKGSLLRIKEE